MKLRLVFITAVLIFVSISCVVNTTKQERVEREIFYKKPYLSRQLLDNIGFEVVWDFHVGRKRIKNMWLTRPERVQIKEKAKEIKSVFLILTEDRTLYRINPKSGVTEWAYKLTGELKYEPFVYYYPYEKGLENPDDELIIVVNDWVEVVSLDRGELLYKMILDDISPASSAWASRSHVYIGAWDQCAYAFKKLDHKSPPHWWYRTDGNILAHGEVNDPSVFVVSEDGRVYSINASKGSENWNFKTLDSIIAPPCLYRNRLYVGSLDFYCYCINAIDGDMEWKFSCEAPVEKTPIAIRGTVYAQSKKNTLFAISRRTGKEMWRNIGGEQILCRGARYSYLRNNFNELVAIDDGTGQTVLKEPAFFKHVDFFCTNTDEEFPAILVGFENGWIFCLKEKEKF